MPGPAGGQTSEGTAIRLLSSHATGPGTHQAGATGEPADPRKGTQTEAGWAVSQIHR
jgi:hypothetical protein